MNSKHHHRSSSQGRKLVTSSTAHPRQKPPLLHRRGHSYNNHVHPPALTSPRPALGGSRKVVTEVTNHNDDAGDDMAGFLQFCATCEKQIVTPGNSILYCSEACRRKDISLPTPPSTTPGTTSYFDHPPQDIIPQRSPTVLRPPSLAFSDFTLSDPGSPTAPHAPNRSHDRSKSDTNPSHQTRQVRAATTFDHHHPLPSLTHTPSTSIDTPPASWSSSTKPLPPRHDPSTGHFPNRSVELVMPGFASLGVGGEEGGAGGSLKSEARTGTSYRVAEAGEVVGPGRRGMEGGGGGGSLRGLMGWE